MVYDMIRVSLGTTTVQQSKNKEHNDDADEVEWRVTPVSFTCELRISDTVSHPKTDVALKCKAHFIKEQHTIFCTFLVLCI